MRKRSSNETSQLAEVHKGTVLSMLRLNSIETTQQGEPRKIEELTEHTIEGMRIKYTGLRRRQIQEL